MNTETSLSLSQAITGYILNCHGKKLSKNTIADYKNTLRKFVEYFSENQNIDDINSDDISRFFANQTVSNKTLSNYYTTINGLWSYLQKRDLVQKNPIEKLDRPRPERRAIDPIPLDQIQLLLTSSRYSLKKKVSGKRSYRVKLKTADRNTALILFLLDNGVRATELCNLQIKDVDFPNFRAFVFGKGAAERFIPFSERTAEAVWLYHNKRKHLGPEDYLFATEKERAFDKNSLRHLLLNVANRAGLRNIHPHRFRHTFAINYLRAGGDPYTLQSILGHTTLDMVKNYLKIARTDISLAHRRASPVEYLKL